MSDVPKGWEWARLDEVAEVRLGRQRSPKNHTGSQLRPYLRAANVGWQGLRLDDVKMMNFTDKEAEIYRLKYGDIVVAEASGSPGEVGKPALWHDEIEGCCLQNTLIRVRSSGAVEPSYLLHFIRAEALRGAFAEKSRGVGIYHLGSARLAEWAIPVPPLSEQHRIVADVEANISHLDAGIDLLADIEHRLSLMSTSLRVDLLALDDETSEWKEVSIGEIATSVQNGCFVSRPGSTPNGVAILRVGAVRSLHLDLNDIRYSGLTSSELRKSGRLLEAGDMLFTRYNGNPNYVGACAVVPLLNRDLTYPDKLIRVKIDTAVADPEFVAIACSSGKSRVQIRGLAKTTAGQAGISGRELKTVRMHLPSLNVQNQIAKRYNEIISNILCLRDIVGSRVRQSAKLRRSLLREAFVGRLVPQDSNDEPASVQLARIRAERTVQPKARRTRRTSKKSDEQGSLL